MSRIRRVAVAAALLLTITGAAACAPGTPTAVISIPGSHTFYASQDLFGNYVRPQGTVAFCLTEPTSLVASGGNIFISVKFDDVFYVSADSLNNTVVTPVIGPGCGTLSASAVNVLEGTLKSMTVTLEENAAP